MLTTKRGLVVRYVIPTSSTITYLLISVWYLYTMNEIIRNYIHSFIISSDYCHLYSFYLHISRSFEDSLVVSRQERCAFVEAAEGLQVL